MLAFNDCLQDRPFQICDDAALGSFLVYSRAVLALNVCFKQISIFDYISRKGDSCQRAFHYRYKPGTVLEVAKWCLRNKVHLVRCAHARCLDTSFVILE